MENAGSELLDFYFSKCPLGGIVEGYSHQKVKHIYWGNQDLWHTIC